MDSTSTSFDLLAPELCADAHPLLHRLRRDDPVHPSPQLGGWLLTRFEDIAAALRDPRITSASTNGLIDSMSEAERRQLSHLRDTVAMWMGHTSPADHLRFQLLLKRYFTGRAVEQLRPKARALVEARLDAALARGEADVVGDLANPLSAGVIAAMLGTPTEELEQIHRWSQEINFIFQQRDFAGLVRVQAAVVEMGDYLRRFIAARRRERREDLISVFLDGEAEGAVRGEEEIIANCILLLFAGQETTATLMSHGAWLLLQNPAQLEQLRGDPERLPSAIEEIARFDVPVPLIYHQALEDFELGGKTISARQTICMALSAGNRDPSVFSDPDRFDVTRRSTRHLGFGHGPSYCLGAPLARMEAHVFFEAMLRRLPGMRLLDEPRWQPLPPLRRRLRTLRVTF